MSGYLIVYSSTDGHTKIICDRIKNLLNSTSSIKVLSIIDAKEQDLSKFSKIIIGASIRYGKHSKELYKFIERNKNLLNQKQNVFFFSKCSCKKT